jgi:type IV pilus assembly protein PilO
MNKNLLALFGARICAQFRGLDFGNPSAWPLVPRVFLLVGLYCLTIGLLWFYPLSDQADELHKSLEKEQALRAEFIDKLGKAAHLQVLKNQRDEVALTVKGLEKQLPKSTEMSSLLFSISQMGRDQNLQQELFKPEAPIYKPYYAIIPVTFRAHGSYHDVARFAADVANLGRIVNLSNMTIWPRPEGALTLETTVRTYRHLDPDELAARASGAEVGK